MLRNKRSMLFMAALGLLNVAVSAHGLGTVTITGVASDNSAVKIYFNAVPGAMDYRVYDIATPTSVKYAGLTNEKSMTPVVATQIDWNNVGDGLQHTLVVEAVDALGPVCKASLYNEDTNLALFPPLPAGVMLGSNKGPTPDGKISTNGQGPYTNNPQAIAVSPPFFVQADRNYKAIPSRGDATSTFMDTFEDAENTTIRQTYYAPNTGSKASYAMNEGTPLSETIQYQLADIVDSVPFISSNHFMDMLFDGDDPGLSMHQGHGVMAFSPDATASWGPGQILHVTEEVDGHTDARRWMDVVIVPAGEPARAFDAATDSYNADNQALRLQIFNGDGLYADGPCSLDIYNGPPMNGGNPLPTGTAGGANGSSLWGNNNVPCNVPYNGLSFDNKSRFDFFISQTHAAYFIDGQLIHQADFPASSFPWANQPVKIYYSHYVYHTDNDLLDLITNGAHPLCGPMNSFWFNDPLNGIAPGLTFSDGSKYICTNTYPPGYGFLRSDERHWDNMGFEILPGAAAPANDFSSLGSLVQPPAIQPPQFTGGPPTSACDLNGDGVTNVSDVQLCVNQAIGVASCTTGDINKDGTCNVIDVQRDVNAALGGACVTQ